MLLLCQLRTSSFLLAYAQSKSGEANLLRRRAIPLVPCFIRCFIRHSDRCSIQRFIRRFIWRFFIQRFIRFFVCFVPISFILTEASKTISLPLRFPFRRSKALHRHPQALNIASCHGASCYRASLFPDADSILPVRETR